jgi:hypothetical protein
VNDASSLYQEQEDRRKLPRTLMGGTAAMREARTEYLPQEEAETEDAYDSRLNRTSLYNGFRKTVKNHTGRVFDRPIRVTGPEVLVDEWIPNITNEGRNLTVFAKGVFTRTLAEGIGFIQVEYPAAPQERSARDEREMALRPYLIEIKPEQLIYWAWSIDGGVPRVERVRIREEAFDDSGDEITQVRELEPGMWRVYRRTESSNDWMIWDEGVTDPIKEIPIIPVYADKEGVYQSEPPLADLGDLNESHWKSSSDQRHVLHVARVPILFGAGLEDDMDRIIIGPNRLVKTRSPQASLTFVEHTGAAIEAGRQDLLDLEKRMGAMGLELLIPNRPGDMTATERAINKAESESDLQIMARGLQNSLQDALELMLEWEGITGEIEVDVNSSFQLTISETSELTELRELRMAGDLSRDSLWAEFKRRGVLRDDFEAEEETEKLEAEGPPPPLELVPGAQES